MTPQGPLSVSPDSYSSLYFAPPWQMLAAIGETFETPYSDEPPSGAPDSADAPESESAPSSAPQPPAADAPASSSSSAAPSPLPSTFSNEITGVIVSVRKAFYRINIWTRTSNPEPVHKARIENIGRHFKYGVLGFDKGLTFSQKDKVSSDVEFVSHADSQAKVRPLLPHAYLQSGALIRHDLDPQYGTKVTKWTV